MATEVDLDAKEILEAALDKWKFLLRRVFPDAHVTDTMEDSYSN